jgi:hypothetical protein
VTPEDKNRLQAVLRVAGNEQWLASTEQQMAKLTMRDSKEDELSLAA